MPASEKIRVALIGPRGDGHHAGYLLDLAVGLNAMGVAVLVMAPQKVCKRAESLGLDASVYELPSYAGLRRQLSGFVLYKDAIREATAWRATHIHFLYADWNVSGIAAAWMSSISRTGADLVLTVHWAAGVGAGHGTAKSYIRRMPHRFALRWLVGRYRALIQVHHLAVANMIQQHLGIKRMQISVVPYPVEPPRQIARSKVELFRQELGLGENEKLVLCYGGTRHDKGADLAIRAVAELPTHYHLLIAGIAQHFNAHKLNAYAEKFNVTDKVHVMDRWLDDGESAIVFQAADVVLLPYRKEFSGQSGPLVQGAANGKPVVVPELPVLEDTVVAFGIGVTYPPEDICAMACAIDRAVKQGMSQCKQLAFVDSHSPLSFAQAVLEGYCHGSGYAG